VWDGPPRAAPLASLAADKPSEQALGPGKLDGHSDRKARVAVRFCIYWAGPPLLAGAAAVKRKTHRMYLHTPIEDHSVYN
jgi:hypothetical protein